MRFFVGAALATALLAAGPILAQAPATSVTQENLAVARELIEVMKVTDNFKAIIPQILASQKAMVVQNRPEVEKQYDARTPIIEKIALQRFNELKEALAAVYARNLTVDEMRDVIAFYRTAGGRKLVEVTPTINSQALEAGRQFGASIKADIDKEMGQQPN